MHQQHQPGNSSGCRTPATKHRLRHTPCFRSLRNHHCAAHRRLGHCKAQPTDNSDSNWRNSLSRGDPQDSSDGSAVNSVLSSSEDLDLQLQQAARFQQAFQDGTLGFGFSAGGLLFPVSFFERGSGVEGGVKLLSSERYSPCQHNNNVVAHSQRGGRPAGWHGTTGKGRPRLQNAAPMLWQDSKSIEGCLGGHLVPASNLHACLCRGSRGSGIDLQLQVTGSAGASAC